MPATLLAALPLSFDAGFSQLTTAFHVGARVVLLNYLLPRDVIKAIEREKVTGLTAVPPLYIQLTQLAWPESITSHLRYFANTGGRMPRETWMPCAATPQSRPFLMYGLTEAFRSTYLPPGSGQAAGFDRQGHSQCRNPGAARGWFALHPTSRANWCIAARWSAWATGTIRKNRRALQALPVQPRSRGRPGAAGNRRLLGRHGAHGRGRLPLFHWPSRRNDEDLRLSRQPDRSRGDPLRHQNGGRMRGLRRR
jgi:acyl-CoA synthetase (AMP-forming)/AMP-acid ligase II